jgi:hypothetical protein
MARSTRRFGVFVAAILIVLMVTIAASAAVKPKITLKAASSSCKVGKSAKVSATVTGGKAYEVWIYKKVGSSWKKVVTATLVSSGHYSAYVKATARGTMQLKAACVNSSRSVTAWSNVVSIKVTG